tara:strand:+ start:77 stop:1147 length:1071 start_codon:yes stop_codon:yes gene_type:complete
MRIEQLTFTRFIAGISIVIFHYAKEIPPFNFDMTSFFFKQANLGVSYFFILSGFVMVIAYYHKDKVSFLSYMQKRFARIYPVTFLAAFLLLFFKVLEFFLSPEKSDLNITDFFISISLQQAWIPAKAMTFNTPAWSITVEWFFYLCFPSLFNYFYKRPNLKMLSAIVLIIWVFSQFILHYLLDSSYYTGFPSTSHSFIHYFPLLHLNEFLIGNVAGLVFIKYLKDQKKANDLAIIALLVVAAIVLKYNTVLSFHNGLLMLVFVPLILLISCNNGLFSKLFKLKFLVFLGEISFGIYILQKPIFMLIKGVFTALNWHQPILQFYISFIVLLLVSAISYYYFETPLRRKISMVKLFKK